MPSVSSFPVRFSGAEECLFQGFESWFLVPRGCRSLYSRESVACLVFSVYGKVIGAV
jgi:hypothetical protein